MFRVGVKPADLRHVLYFLVSSLKEKIAGIQRGPCIFGSMQLIWPLILKLIRRSPPRSGVRHHLIPGGILGHSEGEVCGPG